MQSFGERWRRWFARLWRAPAAILLLGQALTCLGAAAPQVFTIELQGDSALISAGSFKRTLSRVGRNLSTTSLAVDGSERLTAPAAEFSVTVSFASPDRRPSGLKPGHMLPIETPSHFAPNADSSAAGGVSDGGVTWTNPVALEANSWSASFDSLDWRVTRPGSGTKRLTVRASCRQASPTAGLAVSLRYEIYDSFPAIRKWVAIENQGKHWLKLNNLVIDDLELAEPCRRRRTPLTPGELGAGPSVIAFEDESAERGLIAVSEVPSALRCIEDRGVMGYSPTLFEWVLGPGERFVSEPVSFLAYSGRPEPTVSAVSLPLDRAVESVYLEFLRRHVGMAADQADLCVPRWCSWSNFGQDLTDATMREQAAIAARCGFALVQLDQGWQRDLVGTEPDRRKFPDFRATCRYLQSLGLEIGLWVSCYRSADSPDVRRMPDARSVPLLARDGGFGMSFVSPWREFYARDLARLGKEYGVRYFKQDFTNIKFGDAAEGHESRTRRESLLRGLRGLLAAQQQLHRLAPQVTAQLTHEIYWGTPGVPCDVAALKAAPIYHIPPNDYAGVGHSKQRVRADWPYEPEKLSQQLITGCFRARQRYYAHRGLPLYGLEYYAAHAVNFRGSLTPEIQDRQVCSWLMGAPCAFAGDLASLTRENIERYRRRFDLLRRLEQEFGIYRRFQFSGVPPPTDEGWHWWGKLNAEGFGAVVVLRGSGGPDERAVNIPWVLPDRAYQVRALFKDDSLGRFTGARLRAGALRLKLPSFGQEILELRAAARTQAP